MNPGKLFEADWKNSVPAGVYYQRIKDPAQSFYQSDATRFSLRNPYDCFLFAYPLFFAFELKSTIGTSFSFYRDGVKSASLMIKKNQIDGLNKAAEHKGVTAGFVLNFRKVNRTYLLRIQDFNRLSKSVDKKSFNEKDVIAFDGYLIEQTRKRVRYLYGIDKLIEQERRMLNV